MNFECNNCGSGNVFTEEKGSQVGLYCGMCGKWIKWLSKDEQRLYRREFEEIKFTSEQSKEIERLCKISKNKVLDELISTVSEWEESSKFLGNNEEVNAFQAVIGLANKLKK